MRYVRMAGQGECFSFMVPIVPADGQGVSSSCRICYRTIWKIWKRQEVFINNGDIYCASASAMFGVPVEKHGENAHLRQKGKIAELALGYGGSVGALKSMGALEMGLEEEELQPLVDMWRQSNPNIVRFWWDVDRAVKKCSKEQDTGRGKRYAILLPEWNAVYQVAIWKTIILCETKDGRE